MRADRLRHGQLLEQINQLGRYGHRVAQRVARGESPWQGIAPEQARRVLGALERAGIVEQGTERGSWTVIEPLFRRYLATPPHDRPRVP
jgi:hypothetical protein